MKLLFSVKLSDCRVDTFSAGGPGGQNQNRRSSGVRIVHEPSGAVGEARDTRDQIHNKRAAMRRMADKPEFQRWVRAKAAQMMGKPTPEHVVEEQMREHNIKVETRVRNLLGQESWVEFFDGGYVKVEIPPRTPKDCTK